MEGELMPSLTLQQFPLYYRALLHLTRHDHAIEDTVHPLEITNEGMADAIGRTRAQSSATISYLVDQGWALHEKHRITDGRNLKTLTLTPAGRMEAARATRIAANFGYSVEDAIRAPPSLFGDADRLLQRCLDLQKQVNDLRRQVESFIGGTA